jgi:hypothetical protein
MFASVTETEAARPQNAHSRNGMDQAGWRRHGHAERDCGGCIIVMGTSMETKEFERFVASQQGTDTDTDIDWIQMREEWLRDLDSLHRKIVAFLQDYIEAGSIKYSLTKVEVTEPEIGTYLADRMDISIGKQHVSLAPVGTLLVGYKGRVDAEGSAGRAQIVLVNESAKSAADLIKVTINAKGNLPSSPSEQKKIAWVWKIVTNTPPRKFVVLDKESLFALLMEIANA